MAKGDTLYMVIPCYNEEQVLPETSKRIKQKMSDLIAAGVVGAQSRVLLVDDGSKDATWALIESLHESDPLFSGLKLSKNRGHQNALLAGLMSCRALCDVSISMDADLQDDIEAIDGFLEKYNDESCDIVFGVRNNRETDTGFKRGSAQGFYKFMNSMGAHVVYNHADYRLMSRRALDALAQFGEVNLFLRGMVTLLGFKTAEVEYKRGERFAGESKYPLKKMVSFAIEGISSFSTKPIRMITVLGLIIILVSIAALIYSLISLIVGNAVAGWTSTVMSIWLIGGIQIFSLGIIGEYVGKIYNETKARPRYIIEEFLDDNKDKQ